jgi:LysM repeat protein
MRWRVVALGSIGVNLALAAALVVTTRHFYLTRLQYLSSPETQSPGPSAPKLLVRRQFFSWRDVESTDYPTYIANLRDIGCPEQTIRDIIIADINAMYSRRRAMEIVTAGQQWWRSEPDSNVVAVAAEKFRVLDDERRALLGRLLGTNWEGGDLVNLPRPSRPGIVLDGPVLGALPADTKQAVEEINMRSQDRLQGYLDAQKREGKEPDPVELAKLRQQTRVELQGILAPPELEEYLLRYSEDANSLRTELGRLKYFAATPDEFRAVFRSTDLLDEQIALLDGATDANSVAQRKNLEDQRDNAIKLALGPQRYEQFLLLHDPLYVAAVTTAQEAGTPDQARLIYQLNVASASEQDRIRLDPTLTPEQKAIELKKLELDQLKADAVATGQELPPEPGDQAAAPPKKTYVLRPGDTASVVSMIYGVPVTALRAANPNLDLNRLKPGDSLNIPPANLPPPPPR